MKFSKNPSKNYQNAQHEKLRRIEKVFEARQVKIDGIPENPQATKQSPRDLVCELFARMLKVPCGGPKKPDSVMVENAERIGRGTNRYAFICFFLHKKATF